MSKKLKNKNLSRSNALKRENITDPRFDSMYSAPLFKKFRKDDNKLKLDNRFKTVLTEERFRSTPGEVDKYGRTSRNSSKKAAKDELENFYAIEDEEGAREGDEASSTQKSSTESRLEYLNKLSRGDMSDDSSSSSDDDEEESSNDSSGSSDDSSANSMQQDEEVLSDEEEAPTGDASNRLALQNCDWDSLSAEDLIVVLQSFCPTGHTVRKVTVYPSDFGKEQMANEEKYGPTPIWEKFIDKQGHHGIEDDEDIYEGVVVDGEGSEDYGDEEAEVKNKVKGADFRRSKNIVGLVMQEELVRRGKADKSTLDGEDFEDVSGEAVGLNKVALRKYELNKLKYYFAVADFDSIEAADYVYKELDGMELENSSMTFDLRFVPDDVDLSDREARDSCTSTSVAPSYKPPDFIVQALQRTNVECTWDEGDRERGRKLGRSFGGWKDLNESELQQYLASDSDEDKEGIKKTHMDTDNIQSEKRGKKDLRKLLLGDQSDVGDSEDDDFFLQGDEDHEEDDNKDGSDIDKEYSFIPGENTGATDTVIQHEESPFEKIKRKLAEKRRAKKLKKKEQNKEKENEARHNDDIKTNSLQNSQLQTMVKKTASKDVLDLMFSDSGEGDYDMRAVVKAEKESKTSKKPKKKKQNGIAESDNFKIDLTDDRFAAMMQGDSKFGIDPLAPEYKETQAMRKVIKEVKKRRKKDENYGEVQQEGQSASSKVDLGALKHRMKNKLN